MVHVLGQSTFKWPISFAFAHFHLPNPFHRAKSTPEFNLRPVLDLGYSERFGDRAEQVDNFTIRSKCRNFYI